MTLDDLVSLYQEVFKDSITSSLFTVQQVVDWINEAENEACRRSMLLVDSANAMCSLSAGVGSQSFSLNPLIIFVLRAKCANGTRALYETTLENMDMYLPNWEAAPAGAPMMLWTNMQTLMFSVYPAFAKADTIKLTVARCPLNPMTLASPSPSPEIPARFHRQLMDWVIYRTLNIRDPDVLGGLDPTRLWTANDFLSSFESSFGPRPQSTDEARALLGYPRSNAFGQNADMGGAVIRRGANAA